MRLQLSPRRRRTILNRVSVFALAALCAGAAAATPAAKSGSGVQAKSVDIASRIFDDAQLHGDRAMLDAMLAPDFLFVRGSGRATGREEFIASFTDPAQHFEPFVIEDRRVIPIGSAGAVITGRGTIRGTASGKPFEDHFRYADTLARSLRGWTVVYVQVTPLTPVAVERAR